MSNKSRVSPSFVKKNIQEIEFHSALESILFLLNVPNRSDCEIVAWSRFLYLERLTNANFSKVNSKYLAINLLKWIKFHPKQTIQANSFRLKLTASSRT